MSVNRQTDGVTQKVLIETGPGGILDRMQNKPFIHDDFMLESPQARQLYHEFAAPMPIVDFHCHLSPREIAEDKRWENLAQIWLAGDHYKWRAMRSNGVSERYCTGDASDWEKFEQWAATMPYLLRNPLYHWTQLELARYFGVSDLLGPATARAIWERGNAQLARSDFSSRSLMLRSGVAAVCTTDDPCDTLEHHAALAADRAFAVKVLPTWRPDKALAVESPAAFNAWVDRLAQAAGTDIRDVDGLLSALSARHRYFEERGCLLSDYGVETVCADACTHAEMAKIFARVRGGKPPAPEDVRRYRSAMHHELALMDGAAGWTMQIHYGALRNNNTAMFEAVGPDKGFDPIGDFAIGRALSRFLDRLSRAGRLPKTILYNLNPRDNELLASMLGNFQDGSIPGKMQHGSGWWFLDQKDGMERQIESLSQLGLFSRFVGMLTDSRSFLSYTRHEYFRRILCNILGRDMVKGLVPDDVSMVGRMVKDISYNNAARYFSFGLPVID